MQSKTAWLLADWYWACWCWAARYLTRSRVACPWRRGRGGRVTGRGGCGGLEAFCALGCLRLLGAVGCFGGGKTSSSRTSKWLGDAKCAGGLAGLWSALRWVAFSSRRTCPRLRVLLTNVKPSESTLGTAGNGGVACSTLGTGAGDGAAELKMVASWRSAAWCSSASGLKGDAAWGCFKAWIKSWAAAVAASAEDVRGNGT